MILYKSFANSLTLISLLNFLHGVCSDRFNAYRHTRVLDKAGKYVLNWLADLDYQRIYFNVTVETRGYIGFGLSRKGLMLGADLVLGGVHPNGKPYFSDRHGVGQQLPVVDKSQDYTLHSAWESKTHTHLSFSRPFETCDDKDDLSINNDNLIAVIWSYGETDKEIYHNQNRGMLNLYLLDPDLTPQEIVEQTYVNVTTPAPITQLGDWKVWSIPLNREMPARGTTYICTFHKAPAHDKKHHIVGFRPVPNSDLERRHIHHFILHRCHPPVGVPANQFFGGFINNPQGEECYVLTSPENRIPMPYCIELTHEWSVGEGPVFLPEHTGLPFLEDRDEFYIVQMHYDNPQEIPNIQLQFSLEVYYTDKLRKYDAGLLAVGHMIGMLNAPIGILVPPGELSHTIYGHCASGCTELMIPKEGINVVASKMHTHLAGVGARLMNIRNKKEIPLYIDDNYNFDYQNYRLLSEERKILPGDMLYSRCIYSTPNRDFTTVGGHPTQSEMCHGFVYYYPFIRSGLYALCGSEIRSDAYRNLLQVNGTVFSNQRRNYIVTSPPSNAGLTFQEAANRINWNISTRDQLQTHQLFLPQVSLCYEVGPASVTEQIQLLQQAAQAQNSSQPQPPQPIRPTSATNLNGEIRDPVHEHVSLWPKGLQPYRRESTCPSKW